MRTIGKNRGLARLADADGHFRMVALDQRPPLFEAIAQAKNITRDQVQYSDVTAAKRLLVEALAPYCSSMLFDPNFAVPAAIDVLPARCGLIMTLEEHRVEETQGGRRSKAIANWSVEKIRAMGGDAVKVLAWYRPDADASVNEHQRRFVREIGQECARYDVPYVLELLVYPFLGSANHTPDYVESPGKLPELVIESVREFAKPEYAVDLLKLESPLAAASLPPRDGSAAARAAQKEFDAIGDICREQGIPWVLLSGGAAREKFERVLDFAYAAGAGGFLAGRTIWLEAVRRHFPDRNAVAASLRQDGVAVLEGLNALTKANANAWTARFPAFSDIKQEGDFARAY
ncbi:tagatose 1,6-diphosphate aldolase [Bradyrhizobium sp. LHD-71]|uniref:tagatose 1,6-diphosphate aldolase n=1 Tax=Bradyrhizobium sp. LHD-71 TaxID=3072141 RepID=UPI00280CE2D4|nr:tagatose 1,6-diphosphate aldolase [Bradyrhizobium sp. LHD-71]MDQ8728471.1 tagatose 1,6-diphosphate aldolase [Bradyrhizobium sp. LHD-71]